MRHPFEDMKNSEILELINEYIHSERDRSVLVDKLINGYTFEMLSEIYELSDSQVKRIVYRQSETVAKHIGA